MSRVPGSEPDQVAALSQAVLSSEAGRRVGWARAYSAEASKDELSRDVNMLRVERDVMRRAASFLYGFFRAYLEIRGDGHLATQALSRWSQQVGAVLDNEVAKAGREAAQGIVVATEEHVSRREEARAEKKRESNKARPSMETRPRARTDAARQAVRL